MKTLKHEYEHTEEHRAVRRRLSRAKAIRCRLSEEKQLVLDEKQALRHDCQQLDQQNQQCAALLQTYIQQMEIGQRNLAILKANQYYLQDTCWTYQAILSEFESATQLS